jgi:hypothetical protein
MRCRLLAVLGCLLVLALSAPAARATNGLQLGFSADPVLTQGAAASQAVWIGRAIAEGAGLVRVNVVWSSVSPPQRPRGFAPANPASPGYAWAPIDSAVRTLSARGLQVLMNINEAPRWAEGPDRPPGVRPGTWRPDPAQFASFATAAARRYDGRFPDPLHPGAFLPRVGYWQAWNEPNLDDYLSPQWTRTRQGWTPASPIIFRRLLNAFYSAVKAVARSNFVVMGGTAPYGDAPGGHRMQPVAFDRALFCLRGAVGLTPVSCPDPPHLDAVSHHPYATGGPLQPAYNPDDAAVPDLHKIARVLLAAERNGHVLPRGPKRLWVTEISWDSSPPDPAGVPIVEQAHWLEQALYVLWRQGVDTVLWLQIVDSPPIPSYATSYQAGLYYLSGRPKPAAQAFRFPFVTRRLDRGHVYAWGRAPQAGEVMIEVRHGRHWVVVRRLAAGAEQVFQSTLGIRGSAVLRARLGSQTSITWGQQP